MSRTPQKLPKQIFSPTNSQLPTLRQLAQRPPMVDNDDQNQALQYISIHMNTPTQLEQVISFIQILAASAPEKLSKLIPIVTDQTSTDVVDLLAVKIAESRPTPEILSSVISSLRRFIVYDDLIAILNPPADLVMSTLVQFATAPLSVQHRFVELYVKQSKASFVTRCKLHRAVRTGSFTDVDFKNPQLTDDAATTPTTQIVGDTHGDVFRPPTQPIELTPDPLLKQLLNDYLQFNDERQKLLLDLAGKFIYDSCRIQFEDGKLVSVHGANFEQYVCPFQLVSEPELLKVFSSYSPAVILSTLLDFLQDGNIAMLTADYQSLLFLAFSKFGYFAGEMMPTEGEDWGIVSYADYVEKQVQNSIPTRHLLQNFDTNDLKLLCQKILVHCLAGSLSSHSEAAENREVATLYFMNVSCQLLINRPSYLMFVLDALLQYGKEASALLQDKQLSQDKYIHSLSHVVEPAVMNVMLQHLEYGCKLTNCTEEHMQLVEQCNNSFIKFLKIVFDTYSEVLSEILQNKIVAKLFRLLKDNKFQYKTLFVMLFNKLRDSSKLFNQMISTFDTDLIDDLVQFLEEDKMRTEIVMLYECIFHSQLPISAITLEKMAKTVVVPKNYLTMYVEIYLQTRSETYFIRNFDAEKFESGDLANFIIHQPLLFHYVLQNEIDPIRCKKYKEILLSWQNINLLDTFTIDFCNHVLTMSDKDIVQDSCAETLFDIATAASVFNPSWMQLMFSKFNSKITRQLEIINQIMSNSQFFSIIDASQGTIKVNWGKPEFELRQSVIMLEYHIKGIPQSENILTVQMKQSAIYIFYEDNRLNVMIGPQHMAFDVYTHNCMEHHVTIEINGLSSTVIVNHEHSVPFSSLQQSHMQALNLGSFSNNIYFLINRFEITHNTDVLNLNPFQLRPHRANIESINIRQQQKYTYQQLLDNMNPILIHYFSSSPLQILQIFRQFIQIGARLEKQALICVENGLDMRCSRNEDLESFVSLCGQEISLVESFVLNLNRYLNIGFQEIERLYDLGVSQKVQQYVSRTVAQFDDLQIACVNLLTQEVKLEEQQQCEYVRITNFINKIMDGWSGSIKKNNTIDLLVYVLACGASSFQLVSILNFASLYGSVTSLQFNFNILQTSAAQERVQQLCHMFTEDQQPGLSINNILARALAARVQTQYITQLLWFAVVVLHSFEQHSPVQQHAVKQFLSYVLENVVVRQTSAEFIDYFLLSMICQNAISQSLIRQIQSQKSAIGMYMLLNFAQYVDDQMVLRSILQTVHDNCDFKIPFLLKLVARLTSRQLEAESINLITNILSDLAEQTYNNKYEQYQSFGLMFVQAFKPLEVPIKELLQRVQHGFRYQSAYSCILLDFFFQREKDSGMMHVRKHMIERQINFQFQAAISHLGMQKKDNFLDLNDTFGEIVHQTTRAVIVEVGRKFVRKEVDRLNKIIDLIEKTEQTLRLFIFVEGLQAGDPHLRLIELIQPLITPSFFKLLRQMEKQKQELNQKLLDTVPFNYYRKDFTAFERFFDLQNIYDGFRTRLFLHQVIFLEGRLLCQYIDDQLFSKAQLSSKIITQLSEYVADDLDLDIYDPKKEAKLNVEDSKKIQQLFIMMLIAFVEKNGIHGKQIISVYIWRISRLYRAALQLLPTGSEAAVLQQFMNEILVQTSFYSLSVVLEQAPITHRLREQMHELFCSIKWDFRDNVDTRVLLLDLKYITAEERPVDARIQRLVLRYHETLDQRIVRKMFVEFCSSLQNQMRLTHQCHVRLVNNSYKAKIFAFNELYVVRDQSVDIIQLKEILTAFYLSTTAIIELKSGERMRLELGSEYEPLRQFLLPLLREPCSVMPNLSQTWRGRLISNLSFLVEVSKTACLEDVVLPRLTYPMFPVSLTSTLDETATLGPLPLMQQGIDYGTPTPRDQLTEDDLLFQSRINMANIRDLRLHAEHGLPQVMLNCQDGQEVEGEIRVGEDFVCKRLDQGQVNYLVGFIQQLESNYVSANLHHWLNLVFGPGCRIQSQMIAKTQVFDNPVEPRAPKQTKPPRILRNSYSAYVYEGQYLVCKSLSGCVYYNMAEDAPKPLPPRVDMGSVVSLGGQLTHLRQSDMNLIQAVDVVSGDIAFQFRPPGAGCARMFFGPHYIFCVGEGSVVCYLRVNLQRRQPVVEFVLQCSCVDYVEEYQLDRTYFFVQSGSKCSVYAGETVVFSVERQASRSQMFTSQYIAQEPTGYLLFDLREKRIAQQVEAARGQVDAFVAVDQLWVRGVKLVWAE